MEKKVNYFDNVVLVVVVTCAQERDSKTNKLLSVEFALSKQKSFTFL